MQSSERSICDRTRLRLTVRGIVQGVGFRPYVYALADRFGLDGFVRNDGDGVVIEVEGEASAVEAFVADLPCGLPPLARIDELSRRSVALRGEHGFEIVMSTSSSKSAFVSPDIATCPACRAEAADPANRRYRYPFINCTDCGPRYTIMTTLPYDRTNTSMASFAMCPACQVEYLDPSNRRFHAQPISCPDCGPTLVLRNAAAESLCEGPDLLDAAAAVLCSGEILALKGLGGFQLLCDATDAEAVGRLRERKRRPTKPLAVMFPSMEAIRAAGDLSEAEAALIDSRERPIVIVRKRAESEIAENIAPGIDRIGVFLPTTALHALLLERLGFPVVATSANTSDDPIIIDAAQIPTRLPGVADAILDHDRPIVNACDDSVVQIVGGRLQMIRMARGYAPASLMLARETPRRILAVGAHQKNSIALAFGRTMIVSPHIGDLETVEAQGYFERTVATFGRMYDFVPDTVVSDLHPGYSATAWAAAYAKEHPGVRHATVQHHYAHVLACAAACRVEGAFLGFAFDGTGYGTDGTIWGGEVMRVGEEGYARIAHFRPIRLIGGDKAAREPRRTALSLLFEYYDFETVAAMDLPCVRSFSAQELRTLHTMYSRGLNSPLSSSVGRIFDAAAALCGAVLVAGFEGECGMALEAACQEGEGEVYPYEIAGGIIDLRPMIPAIVADARPDRVATRLINTLVRIVADILSSHPDLPAVFAGGVFQNRVLAERIAAHCRRAGRTMHLSPTIPVNDGGIALGQATALLRAE